jgi:hypothetical protein
MVFIESEGEKQRKHLIEAYHKADEEKKKEIFGPDLEKATGFRDVKEKLTKKKSVEVVVTDLGFPPHILKDDKVFLKRQELEKYRKSDFVLYEGSGKIRFGLIRKISRKSAGGSVLMEYAKKETEIVKENKLLAKVAKIERSGQSIVLCAGLLGKILRMLGC